MAGLAAAQIASVTAVMHFFIRPQFRRTNLFPTKHMRKKTQVELQ